MKQREIKFKVWDFQYKDWAKEAEVSSSIGLEFGIHDYFIHNQREVNRFAFCQFTGQKDNDGKDIYEDEIRTITYGVHHNEPLGLTRNAVVKYDTENARFVYAIINSKVKVDFSIVILSLLRGSVHENPELLK